MREASAPLAGRRVLLLKGELRRGLELAAELTRLGCDVVGPATTAESALTLLRAQGRMDAALLDARQDVAPLVELLRRQAAALVLLVGEGEHPEGYSDAILLSRGADGLQVRRALVAALGRARAAMARA
jgi:hypothetical protein